MTPLLPSPALLLLAVGTLLGLNFPLGKLAQAAQVPAVLWAALISLGASTLLRAPARLEYWGIAIGFGGALLVALARGEAGRPAAWLWVGVGLLIPLLLALGNVYRSLDWPPRADGTWLAVGSHGVAALLLLALCALTGAWRGLPALAGVPWLAAAQVAAAVLMFPLFFRLQALGGPVLLSQIGTVGAGVGVAVGAGLLGERYPPLVWGGVALIALGIGLTVWARRGT